MSGLGKGTLSIRKKDLLTQRDIGLSFKILKMWHKATLGDASINLASLVFPSTELPGASNPTSADILAAKAYINKNSVSISSSHKPFINRLSYDIASSSTINFNGWTAEDGEIFEITINPTPTTGLRVVDASPIIKTGTLTAGSTQFIVGTAFELNKYPNEQVGAVLVYVDGELQARNVGNAAASPSANGNYHEDDAGGRVSNSITFNETFAVDVNIVVISNGLVVSSPSDSRDQAIESLAAQMDVVVADVASTTGNPTTRYQAQPNQVDLAAFGNRVFSLETSRTVDEARITTTETELNLIDSGTYSPTSSNLTGTCTTAALAAGPNQSFWMRVGSMLIVCGRVDITTSGSGAFGFDITLPAAIVSNFASDNKAHGNFQGPGNASVGIIKSVSGDTKLRFAGFATGALSANENRWTLMIQIP